VEGAAVTIDEMIAEIEKRNLIFDDAVRHMSLVCKFSDYIQEAKRELGKEFDHSGQPLAHGIRAMRLQLEKYQGMIDELVREVVKPPDGPF
jgi:hypothetical protein